MTPEAAQEAEAKRKADWQEVERFKAEAAHDRAMRQEAEAKLDAEQFGHGLTKERLATCRNTLEITQGHRAEAEAKLADIAHHLEAHPDSVLTGENGLAAATLRSLRAEERRADDLAERLADVREGLLDMLDGDSPWDTEISHLIRRCEG